MLYKHPHVAAWIPAQILPLLYSFVILQNTGILNITYKIEKLTFTIPLLQYSMMKNLLFDVQFSI